ncbi:TPM domain-containing protein [Tundrisphaera lichenicola]|uniref:TPM domain-containing protein n=1 Tax=Tundrisphaera lichenicola TaxID=2029860 RepID=UPI003EC1553F
MTRLRWLIALPAILVVSSGSTRAAEVRDGAGLFSPEAVKKARAELARIEDEYKVPVTIEAIPSLRGEKIRDVTTRHAEEARAKGMYVLIAKEDSKIFAEPSRGYLKYLTKPRLKGIEDAFIAEFKKRDFDSGLARGVDKIDSTLSEARAEAGGSLRPIPTAGNNRQAAPAGRPGAVVNKPWGIGSLITIVIAILGVFLVIRILGALFSGGRGGYANQQGPMGGPGAYGGGRPGYGAPGYGGGGGGGFMSSMFGGIGGALAGNWLYDQFSGGRHHGVDQTSSYDPGTTPGAGPEWGEGGVGGDWGGGEADAGGDWGGSGGDAGGGDWGGGGGGDWGGGGNDEGGSW